MINKYIKSKQNFAPITYLFSFTIISNLIDDGLIDEEKMKKYIESVEGKNV